MRSLDDLTAMVESASTSTGERYSMLVEIHDAIRAALVETDGDPSATGR
jgi:hypothetical protein